MMAMENSKEAYSLFGGNSSLGIIEAVHQ